jgi:hypothetical protein
MVSFIACLVHCTILNLIIRNYKTTGNADEINGIGQGSQSLPLSILFNNHGNGEE